MKTPILPDNDINSMSTTRRQVLKAAAAGAGLTLLLPGSRLLAATAASAPSLAVGYWKRGNKGTTKGATGDALTDAMTLAPSPGTYEMRVFSVSTNLTMTMDAEYAGGAHHRFWQAWTEQGLLQHSPPVAIRWWADTMKPLPLNISLLGGTGSTRMIAQSGTYVLAIGPNSQTLPPWSSLALRPKTVNGNDLQLVSSISGAVVAFPYAVFSVEAIA